MTIPDVGRAVRAAATSNVTEMAVCFSCTYRIHSSQVQRKVSASPVHHGHHMGVSLTPVLFSSSGSAPCHQWCIETSCRAAYHHS